MTIIKKTIRREAAVANDRGRPIILTVEPGDVLGFRAKGTRTMYRLTIKHCYILAAQAQADYLRAQKKVQRKAQKRLVRLQNKVGIFLK